MSGNQGFQPEHSGQAIRDFMPNISDHQGFHPAHFRPSKIHTENVRPSGTSSKSYQTIKNFIPSIFQAIRDFTVNTSGHRGIHSENCRPSVIFIQNIQSYSDFFKNISGHQGFHTKHFWQSGIFIQNILGHQGFYSEPTWAVCGLPLLPQLWFQDSLPLVIHH
jgi:hypothetical protein